MEHPKGFFSDKNKQIGLQVKKINLCTKASLPKLIFKIS
jgi:hypothetical protein